MTKDDLIELSNLSDQLRNQRTTKIRKNILKQTRNEQLAETFKAIINKQEAF